MVVFKNSPAANTHNLALVKSGSKNAVAVDGAVVNPTNNWLPVGDSSNCTRRPKQDRTANIHRYVIWNLPVCLFISSAQFHDVWRFCGQLKQAGPISTQPTTVELLGPFILVFEPLLQLVGTYRHFVGPLRRPLGNPHASLREGIQEFGGLVPMSNPVPLWEWPSG
jgi:hypothetical protein